MVGVSHPNIQARWSAERRLADVCGTVLFSGTALKPHILTNFAQYFLAVLVSIQLSVFILVNAMALWVDQLLHGAIKKLSSHTVVYDGTFITTAVVRYHQFILLDRR
jgi:hypothetical protein